MRASVQSVMNTLWSCSRLLTVSRSSVEWWPDSGATTSTVGCDFMVSSACGLSVKRLKRNSRQNGLLMATCSCTAIVTPPTVAAVMLKAGFSYSLASRCSRSKPADTRCASGVCEKGDSGWSYNLADALANSENGAISARCVS